MRGRDLEKRRKAAREYYHKNRERKREYARAQYHKHSAAILEKYHANPTKQSNRQRRKNYGMTEEELQAFFAKYENRCCICKKEGSLHGGNSLCIDHNHSTGLVRGLVCRRCNIGLHYRENLEWAAKADAYLKEFQ